MRTVRTLFRVGNRLGRPEAVRTGGGPRRREGRNAVWLAERGWEVDAVDFSAVALEKARTPAAERDVRLRTVHADLTLWAGTVTRPVTGTEGDSRTALDALVRAVRR
ncbi:class I SAM-dependent methyltransferase [Streptomyces sp. NPDC048341]|uniref:class I SAM-dependent methyltransferase n=1 Tax=Streptomyces sp. NPDC048341 TaxID=3154620 RepID=UPI00341CF9CE